MSKELFTNTHMPLHMKVFRFLDYAIGIVHNPIITGIVLTVVSSYINGIQLSQVANKSSFLNFVLFDGHMLDLISNAFNLLFLLRFTVNTYFNVLFEVILLGFQSIYIAYIMNNKISLKTWDLMTGLFYLQVLCPLLINFMTAIDYFCKRLSFKRSLLNFNNNLLPLLLTDSFHYANFQFNLFHNDKILLTYKLLTYSLKFYCLYQYILCEVYNNLTNEFIDFNYGFNYKNYFLIVCILVLMGFDGGYLGLLYYYDM